MLTLLIDISKGFLAIYFLSYYKPGFIDKFFGLYISGEVVSILGSSVVLGHIFSPWLKFKGGKGVATMLGVIVFITFSFEPKNIFFVTTFSWLMIVFFTRYVALGSVISLTVTTIYSFFYLPSLFLFFVLMTLLITYRHKDNFERIRNKTENKISF